MPAMSSSCARSTRRRDAVGDASRGSCHVADTRSPFLESRACPQCTSRIDRAEQRPRQWSGQQPGHEIVDHLVGRGLRVDRRGEPVEQQTVDRVVEQGDLAPPSREARGDVEGDVRVEAGPLPGAEHGGELGTTGALEPQGEQCEGDVAVGREATHDIPDVVGEQLAARRDRRAMLQVLGRRSQTFPDAVDETLDQRAPAAEIVRGRPRGDLRLGVDRSMREPPRTFAGEHGQPGVRELASTRLVPHHAATLAQSLRLLYSQPQQM
ncbi:protein of unknown function [Microbacterium sp. Nx66]|nr:protein of unknown function [Microbacterium sp. Nx66]